MCSEGNLDKLGGSTRSLRSKKSLQSFFFSLLWRFITSLLNVGNTSKVVIYFFLQNFSKMIDYNVMFIIDSDKNQ